MASGVNLLEQPGHVLAEDVHRLQAFFVLLDFAFVPADADPLEADSDPTLRHDALAVARLLR